MKGYDVYMKLLFTKGIIGIIEDSTIILITGDKSIDTKYNYNGEGIQKIEDMFKIKLIGEMGSSEHIWERGNFNFIINQKGVLKDIGTEMYEIDGNIVELYDLVQEKIFNSSDKYYENLGMTPIFISQEGISEEFFMSKDQFEKALDTSPLMKSLKPEFQKKLIYMYDLHSLINDLKHSFYSIENLYTHASNELCYTNNVLNKHINMKNEDSFEYIYNGQQADILSSNFMNVIVRICSTLDILAKLTCEITNIPKEYDKYIKFKSGSLYFSNIGGFEKDFEELNHYKGSIIDKRKSFDEIINIRHTIIHNNFLSNNPKITVGCGTPEINNNKLIYKIIYIWDINEHGTATRWINRSRFYSQSRSVQDYLLSEIVEFYDCFSKTIELFKEYLELE